MVKNYKTELRYKTQKSCKSNGCCPAIYETKNNTYIIIGKFINPESVGLEGKVGISEGVVEIPIELLNKMNRKIKDE